MTTKEQVLEIIEEVIVRDKLNKYKGFDLHEVLELLISKIESEVQEPKIKRLVWNDDIAIVFGYGDYLISYEIYKRQIGTKIYFKLYFNNDCIEMLEKYDQAKAYAQEHFEGLIRGCYI